MDADLKELAEILAKGPKENSLTVRWAAVIGVFVAICSFLFIGFTSNANRLTKLETQYDFTAYNDYVETCRAWGAAAKARLGV